MNIEDYLSDIPEYIKIAMYKAIERNGEEYIKAVYSAHKGHLKAAKKAHKLIDKESEEILKKNPVSCKKGCSYCCHVHIYISQDEAQLIINHCNHNSIDINIERLRKQQNIGIEDWIKQPIEKAQCVFLKDNECQIYNIRPMTCRKFFVASDPKFCDITTINRIAILNNIKVELFVASIFDVREHGSMPDMLIKYLK